MKKDHFRLVVAKVATLFLVLCSSLVHADSPVQGYYVGSPQFWAITAAAACSMYGSSKGSEWAGSVHTNGQCKVTYNGVANEYAYVVPYTKCSDGAMPDTSKPLADQCPAKCNPGSTGPTLNITTGWRTGPDPSAAYATQYPSPVGTPVCAGTCSVSISSVEDCSLELTATGGYYRQFCIYGTQLTGGACSGAEDPNAGRNPPSQAPPEENRCPSGTKQTGLDSAGIPICTGTKTDAPATKNTTTTKTTNPDGSVTETKTTKTTNSDGSQTTETTTTTTNPDGTSTTTSDKTTGNKSDGTKGTDDSTDPERNDMCKKYPHLTMCRNSQISGQCEETACDGDAIQCAIARQVREDACKRQREIDELQASPHYSAAQAALAGNVPGLPSPDNAEQINIANSLDTSSFLGAGACFPDKTFVLQGQTFTIPFSSACEYLVVFRYAIMILAALVAFRTLSSSFLKE